MSAALTAQILRVIQRTCDAQGNVTMIRLAERIAAELTSATASQSCGGSGLWPNEVPGVGTEWVGCPGCEFCGEIQGQHHNGCRLGLGPDEAVELARQAHIAETRAHDSEAVVERARQVLDGWSQDGPDDPAMRLLIRRVREALDGVSK